MTLKLAGLVLLLAFGCGDVPDRPTVELERGFLGEVTFGGTVDFPVRSKRCREANLTTRTIGEAAGTDWCESTLKRIGNAEGHLPEENRMAAQMTIASVPSTLLREPQRFLDELKAGQGLGDKAVALVAFCLVFFGAFGAVLGASSGVVQALVSAVKLPLLFLLTMVICFPTLHILNLLFGAKHSTGQLAVLLVASLAATGTILVGFLPVSLFFLMTNDSYSFFKLLNVAILAIAAFYGVRFLANGMRTLHDGLDQRQAPNRNSVLTLWILLYAFVGSQLAWVTRPYFGVPDMQFEVFRAQRGNFFVDIVDALQELGGVE